MFSGYDARGNVYFVAPPDAIRTRIAVPPTASEAALTRTEWAPGLVRLIKQQAKRGPVSRGPGLGMRPLDGVLLGPFRADVGFDLLIVNTDGTLAERSGNGLTILAQFLQDAGLLTERGPTELRVHHDNPPAAPIEVKIEPSVHGGRPGFWVDMGIPTFGSEAVSAVREASEVSASGGDMFSLVSALARIDPRWTRSVLVNVGNPHCVTIVDAPEALPSMDTLASKPRRLPLRRLANNPRSTKAPGTGKPFRNGINLQWACAVARDTVEARVFERGEGPTASSGTSATAVACAMRRAGLVDGHTIQVKMPGGSAPIRFDERDGQLEKVMLFGEATRL